MKIAIITRHNIINYGSVLQTIALQNVLETMGHEPEIIDYIREDEDYKTIAKVLVTRNERWNKNPLMRYAFIFGKSLEFRISGEKFKKIRDLYLKISNKRYRTINELREVPPIADVYMTGSDQVWGGIGNDKYDSAFFLDFGSSLVPRVSYAASFGRTNIDTEILEVYKVLFEKYMAITVRETSAKEIICDLGYTETTQVLDPTLLLTGKQWDKIVEKECCNVNLEGKKYILVYQRRPNKRIDDYADALSKKTGISVYRISADMHQFIRGGKLIFLPNLCEFLFYLKNAAFLVTDSFHGTAFAINYNVQFVDILPLGTETRNMSILKLTGLSERVVKDFNDFSCIEKRIDFSYANEVLDIERVKSKEVLEKMLIQAREKLHGN